jgi:hypothetical protein
MTFHHFNIETFGIVGSGAMSRVGRAQCCLAPTLPYATDINEPNEARA